MSKIMPQVLAVLLAAVLAGAVLLPTIYTVPLDFLGLSHRFIFDRESLLFLFAALAAAWNGLRIFPLFAILVGSFFTGPLITGMVAAFIIYDRSQKISSWWFLLKDYFFLTLMVISCGLPEPLRAVTTFISVVGVALDFDLGLLGLLPAVLFAHTTKGSLISDDVICILVGIGILSHLIWIWVNGRRVAVTLFSNAVGFSLLSFSFLIKDHSLLPVVIVSVLVVEAMKRVPFQSETKKMGWMIGVAVCLSGFPLFVSEVVPLALAQRGLLWAVPFFPLFIFYLALSYAENLPELPEEIKPKDKQIGYGLLATAVTLGVTGIWWSSFFPPQIDFGKWGINGSLMSFLFEHPTEEPMMEQNLFFASIGLTLLGFLLGFILFKFFKPQDKMNHLEEWLERRHAHSHTFFTQVGRAVPEAHSWLTDLYREARLNIDDYIKRLVFGFLFLGVAWAVVYFLRGGTG